jgi:hypothetical protein
VAYNTAKSGHPADTEVNITAVLKTATDTFLCNIAVDWDYALIHGGDTTITQRMIKLIHEEMKCRNLT